MARASVCTLTLIAALSGLAGAVISPLAGAESSVEAGKKISFDRKLGNCMACHVIGDASLPGNIGPPLVAMKVRFADRARLREQIWDATQRNPQSMMPPFGKHGILSGEEIEKVIDYLMTL